MPATSGDDLDANKVPTAAGVWRRALTNRDFRNLLGAMAVSQTGDWLYGVALVVFVFESTRSVGWVAASVVARQVAFISCSAIGGALADRFDRRRWMIGINLGEATILTTMAAVAGADGPPALMIGLAFCAAVLSSGYHPAVFATVPAVVSEDDLAAANAVVSTVEQVAYAAGPAIGALVVTVSSSSVAFAIDAVTFLVAAVLVGRLRSPGRGDADDEVVSMRERLVEGWRAITGSPSAAVVIAMITGALAAYGFEQVLYVAVSADRLGTGASGVGVMSAAYGAGGIAASLVVGRIAGRDRPVPILAAAISVSALSLVTLAAITAPAFAYLVLFAGGAGFLILDVVSVTVLQRTVDPKVMGRVFGILMTLGSTATLVGSLVAPALAGIDLRIALLVGGGIPLLVLAAVAPRVARLDRTATERGRELKPRVALLSSLGLFDGAPVPTLERLAASLTEYAVSAGTAVVREGDTADAFFVVRTGTFEVTVQRGADTITIDELHPDDWFGEIGLVDRAPRNATVTAATEALLWRLEGDEFLAALEQAPGLPDALRAQITVRAARARNAGLP
jgi:MFS family permease